MNKLYFTQTVIQPVTSIQPVLKGYTFTEPYPSEVYIYIYICVCVCVCVCVLTYIQDSH